MNEWQDVSTKAIKLLHDGNVRESISAFASAVALAPDQAHLRYHFAIALKGLGDNKAAELQYRHAIRLKPDFVEALNNLGSILLDSKRPVEALGVFDQAIRINPKHTAAFVNRARTLRSVGRRREAISDYEVALSLSPTSAETWLNFGIILLDEERLDEALAAVEKAIEFKPMLIPAYIACATILGKLEHYEEAIVNYHHIISLDPHNVRAYVGLGRCLQIRALSEGSLGAARSALDMAEKALSVEPNDREARLLKAEVNNILHPSKIRWLFRHKP